MVTATLNVPDVSCEHCKMTIEQAIGALSGMKECSVDIQQKQVTVTYDPSQISTAEIATHLEEEGYPVATI